MSAIAMIERNIPDLEDLYQQLDDCIERNLFLEHILSQTSQSLSPDDIAKLLNDVRRFIGARHFALNINGKWMTDMPSWVRTYRRPVKSTIDVVGNLEVLVTPFAQGWSIFWDKNEAFSADDLRLANTLSEVISPVVATIELRHEKALAMLREHERKLTAQLWRTIVPERLPNIKGYTIRSISEPAIDFGGDFYFGVDNWIVLGDVSGKGMTAAFVAGMFAPAFRMAVRQENVAEALEHSMFEELEKLEMFTTLAAVELSPSGRIGYFNLGHTAILHKKLNGEIRSLKASAPPLGTFELVDSRLRYLDLQAGEMLCIYSDGISEAHKESDKLYSFGEEGMKEVLTQSPDPQTAILGLRDSLEGWLVHDDLTAVIIQFNGSG
ncbi:MAG: PP2C family protein-serine/threonine phosphatase [Deinococcales bacterium]